MDASEDKPSISRRGEPDSDEVEVDIDGGSIAGDDEADAAELIAMKARGVWSCLWR
jgi:hypothetical protein